MSLHMNKWRNVVMDDGWVHPLAKPLPSLVSNLWWTIMMDNWNLDEMWVGKWQKLQYCKSITPKTKVLRMTINGGTTFSVGNTTPQFKTSVEQYN